MIYSTGFHKPSAELKKLATERADDSFEARIKADLEFLLADFELEKETCIALTMKNCEPHNDTWLGRGREPKVRHAFFWIVRLDSQQFLWLHAGTQAANLREGQFVIFDDSVMHSIISDNQWYGIACQLREKEKP